VHWSEVELHEITTTWKSIDKHSLGAKALARMFIVYPWTTRYFGNLKEFTACSYGVKEHAKKVTGALGVAVTHLGDVKSQFTDLSKKHAEELHVDVESFKLLAKCFVVELGILLKDKFAPQTQAIWEKYFGVVVDAISKEYH
uniref:Hemoglobin subunit beta n=1 Tax=Heterodontus portusjacksoni TaxID=7793 RepID=HBB_HETPO|nr:RecName: Full=Hemoglobin subunit beta; AltName: Full=Beta-globin; AltName: Full=Hemoglobin beta chain [Heterodontus portusjacksoni]